jgi:hypothetical protein
MSSRFNKYGSATATEVQHDIPSGQFTRLDLPGQISVQDLIGAYYQYGSAYRIENSGHGKFAAKWDKWNYTPPIGGGGGGTYRYVSTTLIGIFDTFEERRLAVNAALGYDYGAIYYDYYYQDRNLVYGASYAYVNIWRVDTSVNTHSLSVTKPCYLDLLNGYYLDKRSRAELSKLKPKKNQLLEIGYYRENPNEPVSGLRSIDWFQYTIDLQKDKPIYLPIEGCVLGTLWISDSEVKSQLRSMSNKSNEYAVSDYFTEAVPSLFNYWMSLYETEDAKQLPIGEGSLIVNSFTHKVSSTIRRLGANNDVWKNANIVSI